MIKNFLSKHEIVTGFLLLLVFFLFFYKGIAFLDPDLGWHLRMGEYTLRHGISKTDPLSYSMPSYPFVDHEWLINVFMYGLYSGFGSIGLSFVFALCALAALYLQSFLFLKRPWSYFYFVAGSAWLLEYGGVRTQVVSWFFFSLILLIARNTKSWIRFRFFIPVLIFLWANFHGSFPVGIVAVFLIVAVRFWEKKGNFLDLLVFVLSIFATFINPYLFRIWWEVWMQISDSSLHWHIQEWMPMFVSFDPMVFLFLPLSFVLVLVNKKRTPLQDIILYFLFFFLAFSAERHIPFWVLVTIPILGSESAIIEQNITKFKDGKKNIQTVKKIIFFAVVIASIIQLSLTKSEIQIFHESSFFPRNAVSYLSIHPFSGQLFSVYDWGGYLDWKFPQKKVFSDGRMPSWRWNNPPEGESADAFVEQREVLAGKVPLAAFVEKYHISTILLPRDSLDQSHKKQEGDHLPSSLNLLSKKILSYILPKDDLLPTKYNFLKELKELRFGVVYRDSISVIFQKK